MSATLTASSPGLLTVDLDAVARNYERLQKAAAPAICGAVVKADAYGLGLDAIAPVLREVGCEWFFVANLDEGRRLRRLLTDARIFVLAGAEPGEEAAVRDAELVPVLNSLPQIRRWTGNGYSTSYPVAVHIDTGMSRLGLDAAEVEALAADAKLCAALNIELLMTHLACADEPEHPLNEQQLRRFDALRRQLPPAKTCIGNSAGIFAGPRYCGELVRAGIALYGGNPLLGRPNPMECVARLHSPILQLRDLRESATVGYGATHSVQPPARLATVGAGYADGYPRSLGNSGRAYVGGVFVPVVGRVSMDMLTIDVSGVPDAMVYPGAMVELLGEHVDLDELARSAGTISYEILTRLGSRWRRRYERRAAS